MPGWSIEGFRSSKSLGPRRHLSVRDPLCLFFWLSGITYTSTETSQGKAKGAGLVFAQRRFILTHAGANHRNKRLMRQKVRDGSQLVLWPCRLFSLLVYKILDNLGIRKLKSNVEILHRKDNKHKDAC